MTCLLPVIETLLHADGRSRRVSWDELLVHRNSAPLPSPYPGSDTMWNRGFDFLVLEHGQPTHYGRCRSHDDARAGRASHIRATLSEDPELARLVSPTRFAIDGGFLVEISRYARGTLFLREVAGLGDGDLAEAVRRILAANRRVTSQAERRIPSLQGGPSHVNLRAAAESSLEFLAQAGITTGQIAALAAALSAGGSVPARAQHGDLWPANVLRLGDEIVLLDFEVFGEVLVPLFDVFHLLRACLMQRAAAPAPPVLTLLERAGPQAALWDDVVATEAARDGLSRPQTVAAFVFYVAEMTATIRRRNGPESYWAPNWRCLVALADRLQSGASLEGLLLGPRAR